MTSNVQPANGRLITYNATAQHYGEWLRGYDWQIYGCGTFRNSVNERQASAFLKRFFERLEKRVRASIGHCAALEHRYSGLGMSPIPLHWHFLAASNGKDAADLASAGQVLWQELFGNAKIDPYDPAGNAAYYVAKTASLPHCAMEYHILPFVADSEISDTSVAIQQNPYVAQHLKHLNSGIGMQLVGMK